MITRAMGINEDTGYSRAIDLDMLLSHSSGLDFTIATGGSTGHLDLYGPGGNMALKHQHDFMSDQTVGIYKALSGNSCH